MGFGVAFLHVQSPTLEQPGQQVQAGELRGKPEFNEEEPKEQNSTDGTLDGNRGASILTECTTGSSPV